MPEIPNVIAGEPVASSWGNQIRDRTVQRYADAAQRDALVPIPVEGDLAFLEDVAAITLYSEAEWVELAAFDPTGTTLPFPGSGWSRIWNPAARLSLAVGAAIAERVTVIDGGDTQFRSADGSAVVARVDPNGGVFADGVFNTLSELQSIRTVASTHLRMWAQNHDIAVRFIAVQDIMRLQTSRDNNAWVTTLNFITEASGAVRLGIVGSAPMTISNAALTTDAQPQVLTYNNSNGVVGRTAAVDLLAPLQGQIDALQAQLDAL